MLLVTYIWLEQRCKLVFGNVVYYDKKKIDEYRAVVKGQRNLQIDEYEVSNDRGIQIDLKAFGADAKANKTYKAKVKICW